MIVEDGYYLVVVLDNAGKVKGGCVLPCLSMKVSWEWNGDGSTILIEAWCVLYVNYEYPSIAAYKLGRHEACEAFKQLFNYSTALV